MFLFLATLAIILFVLVVTYWVIHSPSDVEFKFILGYRWKLSISVKKKKRK